MFGAVWLICRLTIALAFAVAAVSKATDRRGFEKSLREFGFAGAWVGVMAVAVPAVEAACAAALILAPGPWFGPLPSAGLLLLFTLLIAWNLKAGRRPSCRCFGELSSKPIGPGAIARNGLLFLLSLGAVWHGLSRPSETWVDLARGVSPAAYSLGFSVVACLGLVFFALTTVSLMGRYGEVLGRLERLEGAAGSGEGVDQGLFVGQEVPAFEAPWAKEGRVDSAALFSGSPKTVAVFTDAHCAPCDRLMPDVARMQEEYQDLLRFVVLCKGTPTEAAQKSDQHGLRRVVVADAALFERLDVRLTPCAVLIDEEGRAASATATGRDAILALITGALDIGALSSMPHLSAGQEAPEFALPSTEGRTVALADLPPTPKLLVFFNPSCGYCARMAPNLPGLASEGLQVVVVSRGTAQENASLAGRSGKGLWCLLDESGSVAARYGANGTPMGYLVDGKGVLQSDLAAGEAALAALAALTGGSRRECSCGKMLLECECSALVK